MGEKSLAALLWSPAMQRNTHLVGRLMGKRKWRRPARGLVIGCYAASRDAVESATQRHSRQAESGRGIVTFARRVPGTGRCEQIPRP
jgi:hypothetical protein